jgi:hypothetical protein
LRRRKKKRRKYFDINAFREKLMADFTHIRVVGVESFLYITE